MENMMAQVEALTGELALIKNEIIQVKSAHASLHQQAVDKNTMDVTRHADAASKIASIDERLNQLANNPFTPTTATFNKPLIEPKQIQVPIFAGAVSDSRSKFLEWSEKIKDRVALHDTGVVEAMSNVEQESDPIVEGKSEEMGVGRASSKQLHGF